MGTQKPDDLDDLERDAKDLADKYPENKPSQILHGVAKATVNNTRAISVQTRSGLVNTRAISVQARLGLLAVVGTAVVAVGGFVNTVNHRNLADRVSELESTPKAGDPSVQGGDPQRNPIAQEQKEKNPVQPEQVSPMQESKPEPHIESMPPMVIKPENKGKKAKPHSALAAIMRGDTGALNNKMAVAMSGNGSELKIGHGASSAPYQGPDHTMIQSHNAIRKILRGN